MSVVLEYVQRTKVLRDLASFPCSAMAMNGAGDSLAITIHKKKAGYFIKVWDIDCCNNTSALPPFVEYRTKNLWKDLSSILPEVFILEYQYVDIDIWQNNTYMPIQQFVYDRIVDELLNSSTHSICRANWLWHKFIQIYIYPYEYEMLPDVDKAEVQSEWPQYWKFWLKWEKYLLNYPGIPGELILSDILPTFSFNIW